MISLIILPPKTHDGHLFGPQVCSTPTTIHCGTARELSPTERPLYQGGTRGQGHHRQKNTEQFRCLAEVTTP